MVDTPPGPKRSRLADKNVGDLMKKLVTLVNTNQIRPTIAPIAFDYLHEPLMRAGFEVEILDLCFADDYEEAIAKYCGEKQPDFWGVTLRNSEDTYFSSRQSFLPAVRDMLRALRRHSHAPITMGGVGFSVMPEKILKFCGADFGIVCEGEVAFPMLLTRLARKESYADVPNLVYHTGEGIKSNPVRLAELGDLDPHRRGLIDNEKYFVFGGQAGVETKRGCNRRCIYCVEPLVKGRVVRFRKPSHVVDEMESLADRGIYAIHINDSEFNLSIKHPLAVCDEIIRRGLHRRVQWYAYGMPAPFPNELARRMRAAGCVGMNLGVDSASEKMLRILRRTFKPRDIADAAETCRRNGLRYIIEILFGAPGETAETIKETIDFLKSINAERVSVTAGLRVFPGTELEEMVRAEGLTSDNPNLFGAVEGNDDLLRPLFYLPATIAPKPLEYIAELTRGDERFFGVNSDGFNYNANDILIDAIARGEKGAYWAILSDGVERHRAEMLANASYGTERAAVSVSTVS